MSLLGENFSLSFSAALLALAIFLAMTGFLLLKNRATRIITGVAAALAGIVGVMLYGTIYAEIAAESGGGTMANMLPVAIRTLRATVAMFGGGADYDTFSKTSLTNEAWANIVFWLVHLLAMYALASAVILTLGKLFMRFVRKISLRAFSRRILLVYGGGEKAVRFVSGAVSAHSREQKWLRWVRHRMTHRIVFIGEGAVAERMEQLGGVSITPGTFDGKENCADWLKDVHMGASNRKLTIVCFDDNERKAVSFSSDMLAAIEERHIPAEQVRFIVQCIDEYDYTFLQDARDAGGNRYPTYISSSDERMARLVVRKAPPYKTLPFAMGRAQGDYQAVIVGFGEIGQQLLLQLVINGQFVGSHFSVLVLDPDIDQIAGIFRHNYRAMLEQYDIRFSTLKSSSTAFIDQLVTMLPRLRTIALCTGSEQRNRMLANNLRALLRAHAEELPGQGELYLMQCCADASIIWDRSALLYGTMQQTVETMTVTLSDSHELLEDGIDDTARAVNGCYIGAHSAGELERSWHALDHFSRESSRASADFIPAMLAAVNTTEEQIAALCGEDPAAFGRLWAESLGAEQLETLAQLEHLRWMAFHYANGVRAMTAEEMTERAHKGLTPIQKDIPHFGLGGRHACLIPWEELDEGVALYNKLRQELDPAAPAADWKQNDRNNVLNIPLILYIQRQAEKSE